MENEEHPTRIVSDIVCGMELAMENVRNAFEYNGVEYYFCSDTCKSRFTEDPASFVKRLNTLWVTL